MQFCIYKGTVRKIQRNDGHQTIFALISSRKLESIQFLHQNAAFLVLFQETPISRPSLAILVIWPYGHMTIFRPYDHMPIWPKWPKMAMIWVSPETAIKMQNSGEGIELIRASY